MVACFHRKVAWLRTIMEHPHPVIWLHDAPPQTPGGKTPIPARSDELLASSDGVGRVFSLQARLNAITPQISVVFGDLGAAQTFPVRLADITLLKKGTHLWIGRPDAVKLMLGRAPDPEALGSAVMHCKISGVGDVLFETDEEALDWITRCIPYLPDRKGSLLSDSPPRQPVLTPDQMQKAVPEDLNVPFDMHHVIHGLADTGSWLEIKPLYAPEVITGWARINGHPIGILANNSIARGGVIFPETCKKMVAFIQFCDRWRIPLLFLADNPGLMVGVDTEQAGMLTEASDLLRTLATLTTHRICLVVRKAYTVGLYAMGGPGFDPDGFFATPHASISVFGPKALDGFAADRDLPEPAREAIQLMRHHATHPSDYAEKGYLTGVIEWDALRDTLYREYTQRPSAKGS
jgi:acetyl-CoA carboxylase carboxyltransferase component